MVRKIRANSTGESRYSNTAIMGTFNMESTPKVMMYNQSKGNDLIELN
jgi:hypothetical protein